MNSIADTLDRTSKMFADSGDAQTLADMDTIHATYWLQVHIGLVTDNPALQAAVLTIVNSGARAFKGGVRVFVSQDCTLKTGWQQATTLSLAIEAFGGKAVPDLSDEDPTICIGDTDCTVHGSFVLRAVASGWAGGVVEGQKSPIPETDAFVLAGVAAGGIAVAEAFERRRRKNLIAGRRSQGLSLWRPSLQWLSPEAHGPNDVTYAPAAWWIVGLGHLGQGYLWSIGMLPYADPNTVRLLLQDDKFIKKASESTGLLIPPGSTTTLAQDRKTRVLARTLEDRGFQTTITERRLKSGEGPRGEEPLLALIGVDNLPTRRSLSDTSGFELILDCGLGTGPTEYLDIAIHSFPASRASQEVPSWQDSGEQIDPPDNQPAYADLTAKTGDPCGTVQAAGASVAATFVGATAGALVVAEAIRAIRAEHQHEIINLTLRGLDDLIAVQSGRPARANVGYSRLA